MLLSRSVGPNPDILAIFLVVPVYFGVVMRRRKLYLNELGDLLGLVIEPVSDEAPSASMLLFSARLSLDIVIPSRSPIIFPFYLIS